MSKELTYNEKVDLAMEMGLLYIPSEKEYDAQRESSSESMDYKQTSLTQLPENNI
jgi:predicted transcriptional regulator